MADLNKSETMKMLMDKGALKLGAFADKNPGVSSEVLQAWVDGFSVGVYLAVEILNEATKYERE